MARGGGLQGESERYTLLRWCVVRIAAIVFGDVRKKGSRNELRPPPPPLPDKFLSVLQVTTELLRYSPVPEGVLKGPENRGRG